LRFLAQSAPSPDTREGLGVDGLDYASGVVISDGVGVTALMHNVTESALQNIMINSATGRAGYRRLTLLGLNAIQDSLVLGRFEIHLTDDMIAVAFRLTALKARTRQTDFEAPRDAANQCLLQSQSR
jgi:hypothetical protein